jgi:hypothetical protein
LSPKRLIERAAARQDIADQDRRLIGCQRPMTCYFGGRGARSTYVIDANLAAPLLVGHPLVFAVEDVQQRVEVVEGRITLVAEDRGGQLALALEPPVPPHGANVILRPSTDRVLVYRVEDLHRRIAAILQREVSIPSAGVERLRGLLARLAQRLPIQGSPGLVAGQGLEERAGDPTPFKHFRRQEFVTTVEHMGNVPDGSSVEEILRRDLAFAATETERQISLAYQPASIGIKRSEKHISAGK